MKYAILLIIQISFLNAIFCQNADSSIVNLSRKSTLKILAYDSINGSMSTGTGFFVDVQGTTFILTCLHVIAKQSKTVNSIIVTNYKIIKGVTYNGDTINLSFLSALKNNNVPIEYLERDFATLKCNKLPKNISSLSILSNENLYIGQNVYFSGYPIGCPMLTHMGIISGFENDTSNIFVQSAINSGNSGGALINSKGNVIGIVSTKNLQLFLNFDKYISDVSLNGTRVSFGMTINKDGTTTEQGGTDFNLKLVKTLKSNLNTGIGGAINIKYARNTLYKK